MPQGAFIVAPDDKNPRDIHFKVASDATIVPADQHDLRDETERALTVLRAVYPTDREPDFQLYFRQLVSLAQTGLVGPNAQPDLAMRALKNLKREVVDREAGRIKNAYLERLGKRALLLGLPALIIAYLVYKATGGITREAAYLTIWGGSMGGTWLSFGARKTTLAYEDLHILEQDRLEPTLRLLFAGMIAETSTLLFTLGAAEVSIGTISSTMIATSYQAALLAGILCGLAEQVLPSKLLNRANELMK